MKQISLISALLVATSVVATPMAASANGFVTPPPPPVVIQQHAASRSFPGIFGAASAVPAAGGTGFVALNYVNPRGGISGSDGDGDLQLGYTIGNPIDAVSATVIVNVLGLDPFGDSGELSFSLSRMLRASGNSATFLGASVGDFAGWGDAADDEVSYSVYGSHLVTFSLGSSGELPVQFTLGYGSDTTLSTDGLGVVGDGAFFGVGVGVTETLSLSVSGTETQANIGASLSIPQVPGLGLSAGVYDVFDNTDRQQYSLGVAFAF